VTFPTRGHAIAVNTAATPDTKIITANDFLVAFIAMKAVLFVRWAVAARRAFAIGVFKVVVHISHFQTRARVSDVAGLLALPLLASHCTAMPCRDSL